MWKALGNFPLTLRKICPQLNVKRPSSVCCLFPLGTCSLGHQLTATSPDFPGLLTQERCLPGPIDPGFHNSGFIYHLSLCDDTWPVRIIQWPVLAVNRPFFLLFGPRLPPFLASVTDIEDS